MSFRQLSCRALADGPQVVGNSSSINTLGLRIAIARFGAYLRSGVRRA